MFHLSPVQDISQITTALQQATALEAQGRLAEAEAGYRQLLAAHPGQPAILHRLALLLKARGALAEAESLLRRALQAAPREAVLLSNLGNVLRAGGRAAAAMPLYRKAIELTPSYADAHYNLGVAFEDLSEADEALAAYRQAITLKPDFGVAHTRIGAILRDRGKLDEALAAFDTALAVTPNAFDALYYRALTFAALERFDEAVADLQAAAMQRPSSFDALHALANNLRNAGRNDEALTAYWQAMEMQPANATTHDELNRLAWVSGRSDVFLKSFAYARERTGDDPTLLFAEAQIRMQRNDGRNAEPLLRRAIALQPDRADANALLGRLLSRAGRHEDGFAAFDVAVKSAPDAGVYRNEYGYALLKGHEAKAALVQFEEARRINPHDQLALGGVCVAYRELGDNRYHALVDVEKFVRPFRLNVPAGFIDATAFNAALGEELLRLHTTTAAPLDQTLRGGTQTAGLLFTRKSKLIEQVREAIAEAVAAYVSALPVDAAHPLLSRKDTAFSFTHSWSCKLRSSGFHTNHVHSMGWISSAYYVDLPGAIEDTERRQGWLKFGESHLELGGHDRPEHFVRPQVGELVLFPSYFWHGTVPFESPSDRLTIAFDVVPGIVDPATIAPGPY